VVTGAACVGGTKGSSLLGVNCGLERGHRQGARTDTGGAGALHQVVMSVLTSNGERAQTDRQTDVLLQQVSKNSNER
jgi:hypothetical protein